MHSATHCSTPSAVRVTLSNLLMQKGQLATNNANIKKQL